VAAAAHSARAAHDGDGAEDRLEDGDEGTTSDKSVGSHASAEPAPFSIAKRPTMSDSSRSLPAVTDWLKAAEPSTAVDAAKAVSPAVAAWSAGGSIATNAPWRLEDVGAATTPESPLQTTIATSVAALSPFIAPDVPAPAADPAILLESSPVIAHFAAVDAAGTFGDGLSRFIDECSRIVPSLADAHVVAPHLRAWTTTAVITVVDAAVACHLIRRARRKRLAFISLSR
jgi:hypothetical protein